MSKQDYDYASALMREYFAAIGLEFCDHERNRRPACPECDERWTGIAWRDQARAHLARTAHTDALVRRTLEDIRACGAALGCDPRCSIIEGFAALINELAEALEWSRALGGVDQIVPAFPTFSYAHIIRDLASRLATSQCNATAALSRARPRLPWRPPSEVAKGAAVPEVDGA